MNNISMYTVTGLASNTDYTFAVRAFTRVGSGPFSDDTVRTSKLSVTVVVLISLSTVVLNSRDW